MAAILPTAHTIAVLSQKGGTGKTTMVRTLSDVLRRAGLDVLAVDLDPQGNLSDYFDLDPDVSPTIGEVLTARAHITEAIHDGIVPANLGLAEAELVLSGKMGRELTLKRALREARRDHDVILIDCPPALGLLTVNALVAATHALISAEGEYFSLQGVEQVLEVMGLARDNLNDELEWLGVVLNITDLRGRHAREALASLRESHGEKVFETVIRKSVRYPESAERGVTILDYKPELGIDYIDLGTELLDRLGEEEARERVALLRPQFEAPPTPARERAGSAAPGPGPSLASATPWPSPGAPGRSLP
jgi:chromosome partitioning protein